MFIVTEKEGDCGLNPPHSPYAGTKPVDNSGEPGADEGEGREGKVSRVPVVWKDAVLHHHGEALEQL